MKKTDNKKMEKIKELCTILKNVKELNELKDGESLAWTIAYNIIEMDESSDKIFTNLVPKLFNSKIVDENQIKEKLLEIVLELSHLLWHINHFGYNEFMLNPEPEQKQSIS